MPAPVEARALRGGRTAVIRVWTRCCSSQQPTVADAVRDRVLHNAHRIVLKGPSRGSKRSRRNERAKTTDADHRLYVGQKLNKSAIYETRSGAAAGPGADRAEPKWRNGRGARTRSESAHGQRSISFPQRRDEVRGPRLDGPVGIVGTAHARRPREHVYPLNAAKEGGVVASRYAQTSTEADDFAESYAIDMKVRGTAQEAELRRIFSARFRVLDELVSQRR